MLAIDFKKLSTLPSIASNFNTSKQFLQNIIDSSDIEAFYEIMHIPKKRSRHTYRTVYKANTQLGSFHKNLLVSIEKFISKSNIQEWIHDSAHGFIKGRNTYSNAKLHLNKKKLIQVDIKNFFKSISITHVNEVFLKLCENEVAADILSRLTTVDGTLGEGLHTSPLLANLYFFELDKKLKTIADLNNCCYSRYADDITFSTNDDIDSSIIVGAITDAFNNTPFALNSKKTRVTKKGQPQYVTGLSISNSISPRIPKYIKRLIRQELYYIETIGIEEHFDRKNEPMINGLQRIAGWIVYCFSIEPELAKRFQDKLDCIVGEKVRIYNKRDKKRTYKNVSLLMYFDETLYKNYFGLSCVLMEEPHASEIKVALSDLHDEINADQLINTKGKKIFHYCDDNVDIKNILLEHLRKMEFYAYIGFFRLDKTSYSEDDYLNIFYKLIFDRIHSRYDSNIKIFYEENSKIKHNNIIDKIDHIKKQFSNFEMPELKITAEKVTKSDKMTVISDYVLGIFKDAYLKGMDSQNFEKQNYRKIATKVRLIVDLDNQEFYSRHNPLEIILE